MVVDEGGWTCGKDGQGVPVSHRVCRPSECPPSQLEVWDERSTANCTEIQQLALDLGADEAGHLHLSIHFY